MRRKRERTTLRGMFLLPIYIFKKAVLSFPKAFNAQESWSTKFWVYFGEEGDLWKGDIGEETGQFRGWIEWLSSQGEQSLRQIFTRECILSMWVSATLEDVWVIGVLIGVPLPRILSQDRYHLLLCSPMLFRAYCAPRVYFALIDVSGCREREQNYARKIPNVCEWEKFWQFFINVIDGRSKLHEEEKKRIRGRQITLY